MILSPRVIFISLICAMSLRGAIGKHRLSYAQTEDENDYPFMVEVGTSFDDEDLDITCGGALLSSRIVLTAGHCLNSSIDQLAVPTQVSVWFHQQGHIGLVMDSVLYKYKYGGGKGKVDIGLVVLPEPVPKLCDPVEKWTTRKIAPVRLPIDNLDNLNVNWDNEMVKGSNCRMFGYGNTELPFDENAPMTLRSAPKSVLITQLKNRTVLGYSIKYDRPHETTFCEGDSGSPLICSLNGTDHVLGVETITAGAKPGVAPLCHGDPWATRFGFFEDVRQHIDWIMGEIRAYRLVDDMKKDYNRCGF